MNTILMLLKLLPAILSAAIQSVQAIESGFEAVAQSTGSTLAASGAHKASVLEAAIGAILKTEAALAEKLPEETIVKVFGSIRDAAVKAFNAIGLFKSAAPAPPAA